MSAEEAVRRRTGADVAIIVREQGEGWCRVTRASVRTDRAVVVRDHEKGAEGATRRKVEVLPVAGVVHDLLRGLPPDIPEPDGEGTASFCCVQISVVSSASTVWCWSDGWYGSSGKWFRVGFGDHLPEDAAAVTPEEFRQQVASGLRIAIRCARSREEETLGYV